MGYNDHIDFELVEQIRDVLDEGLIEENTAAYGIAVKVVEEGIQDLSNRQKEIYDWYITPVLSKRAKEIEAIQRINSWPQ